jgi:TolB-like protein
LPEIEVTVPRGEVTNALSRVLRSSSFVQSSRLSRFLEFAVQYLLDGKEEALKEYLIGTEVYGRKVEYDPSQDSIVRTEARRLRSKLKEYYENEGISDPVVIYFRPGSYRPLIRWRTSLTNRPAVENRDKLPELFVEGDGVRVAVEPFQALPGDPTASACAYGISDELVHRLTRTPGIRVVSPSVRSRFGNGATAEDPDVQIIIDGTVRREQKKLRVTAHVSTANGVLLWSQRFDSLAEGDHFLNLQEGVASSLLSRIAPRVARVRNYLHTPTQSLFSLFGEVLAAEALLEEGTVQSIASALKGFEDLTAKAPLYPRPFCGVAQCCIGLAQRGAVASAELTRRARESAEIAVSLDPEMEEGHTALGSALAQEWKWTEAEDCYQTALSLGDYHAAHRQYALFLMCRSRVDEAWRHLQVSQELDPFSARQKIAFAMFLYHSRWRDEARSYFAKMDAYGGAPHFALLLWALIQAHDGLLDQAVAIAESLRSQSGASPFYLGASAEIYALCGQTDRAAKLAAEAHLLSHATRLSFFRKARLALALGDRAKSLELLSQSFEAREAELPWIAVDPGFDNIGGESSFKTILEAVSK